MRDKYRTRSASRLPSALLAWAVLLLSSLYTCSSLGAVPPQHGPLCPFHATSFDDDSDLYFQPQPVNASSLDNACGVSSASCCSSAYLAKVARLQDNISKQLAVNLRVPESVEGKDCQTELNQLRCLPCAADMKGRARLWPPLSDGKPDRRKSGVEDVELELCPDYCARLYSACKEALVVTSGVKVRQHYPSSSVFCRQHFRELFDVRLQTEAGLCYPVAPGCEYASLGRQYTPCVEHSGVECGRGKYLPWGASECSTCAPGTFSSGWPLRLAQWDPRDYLNASLPFVTYCADPKGRRLPPSSSCTGWVVDAEGFVDSGKTAHSRQSALEASLNFIEAGDVTFTFQVSSEAGADVLRFFVDGVMLMDLQSDVTRFTTRTFSVSRGNHLLLWTYAKDEGQSKGLDKAVLSVIEIKGLRYAQDGECSKCPPGTTSQAGAGDCEMCPANYVAAEAGSSACEPCPSDEYALPGSTYCWPRAPCHEHSYHYVYSECVNGSRSKVLEWFQPVICNTSSIDPPLRVDGLPCVTKCPAGEHKPEGSDTCRACADGYYSRSGGRCEACRPGEVALRSLHFKNFTRWEDLPGLSTYCSGRCTSGWLLHDTHAESGHGHGRYAQSTLQLVVQVGPLGGKLTFGFSLVCSERCRFEFASSGRVMGEFFTGDADDKEYSLPQGNYTFTWTFTTHRSGDMPSNDHATIWHGIEIFAQVEGAELCGVVYQGGWYGDGRSWQLHAVPGGDVQPFGGVQLCAMLCRLVQSERVDGVRALSSCPVAGSKCLACGNGVASVDGATNCSISLTYTTTLALPSRPNRAITFDLTALVQRNKPYGPVLGARGIKYYINVGTREVARGPCPPGFGCVVYANGSVASLGYEMSYDDNIIDSLSPDSEATEVSREAAIAEGLRLNFTRGDCGGEVRTTTIAFICDPRAGKGTPEFVHENPACHHQFRWRSLFAARRTSNQTCLL
ncbi:uncharacterized protein ACA1_236060 [Acanthamoeba castellanii str. Neff]|uniref:MRH domain-containing protein n=1 Tax=Acanthamoeba castellanii (strain ATCC 30010 / Neff) TaxID=1257118 RepID=L8H2V7_ACACF|nr:uncharacterized protein ACA1_236060 [Acanthamoeba castellanii str. Neff]ELR19048.1 hypothetical protein ACA1_236060 [Acanthamoeba castellanii str. Neff]